VSPWLCGAAANCFSHCQNYFIFTSQKEEEHKIVHRLKHPFESILVIYSVCLILILVYEASTGERLKDSDVLCLHNFISSDGHITKLQPGKWVLPPSHNV
jgi:hypothetical protein